MFRQIGNFETLGEEQHLIINLLSRKIDNWGLTIPQYVYLSKCIKFGKIIFFSFIQNLRIKIQYNLRYTIEIYRHESFVIVFHIIYPITKQLLLQISIFISSVVLIFKSCHLTNTK